MIDPNCAGWIDMAQDFCEHGIELTESHKLRRISSLAEEVLASQEGLCSM
jgi:hypothetical protein